jgi:hypothetical protein
MIFQEYRLIFPEGDEQEVTRRLSVNQMVDINGIPVVFPLKSFREIVFRVYKISTTNTRNEVITNYHLEQVSIDELKHYTKM